MPVNQNLARARLAACRHWGHATSAILSLVPVERPGLGTCAVDMHGRLYFDPAFLDKCSPDEAAGVILHEVSHLLLNHPNRAQALVAKNDRELFKVWNIAADAAINYNLQQEKVSLPKGVVYPSTLKLEGNQSAEWYFAKLKEQMREEQGKAGQQGKSVCGAGQGSGEAGQESPDGGDDNQAGADGAPVQPQSPGASGSCSDGQDRPWEDGPPVSEEEAEQLKAEGKEPPPAGLEQHEQEQIRQQVAEALKSRGNVRGNVWGGFIEDVLNPKVRHAVDMTTGGTDEYSYRRPSRRPGLGGTLRACPLQIVPRVLVVIDTSGSMGRDDLGLAAGLIAKVLSGLRLRDGVRVLVGDTCVQKASKVFDPKKIEVMGGGGTDMAAVIEQAAEEKPAPDVILVATDGYTGYPAKPVGPRVVVALTRPDAADSVPSWIKKVVIK
jgi:predicted metal-dependent peptidase